MHATITVYATLQRSPFPLPPRAGGPLYFANGEYVYQSILDHVREYTKHNPVKYVILDLTAVASIDTPVVQNLKNLITVLQRSKITLALSNVNANVEDLLHKSQAARIHRH